MNAMCIIIVRVPTDKGVNKLIAYGTPEIGDVPKSAAIESATPSAMIHSPITNVKILEAICSFLIPFLYNHSMEIAKEMILIIF